jgi:hypothetical protein
MPINMEHCSLDEFCLNLKSILWDLHKMEMKVEEEEE